MTNGLNDETTSRQLQMESLHNLPRWRKNQVSSLCSQLSNGSPVKARSSVSYRKFFKKHQVLLTSGILMARRYFISHVNKVKSSQPLRQFTETIMSYLQLNRYSDHHCHCYHCGYCIHHCCHLLVLVLMAIMTLSPSLSFVMISVNVIFRVILIT